MDIRQIKKEMRAYVGMYEGDLFNYEEIYSAKTKRELAEILNSHERYLEDLLTENKQRLDGLRERLGLRTIDLSEPI